MIGINRRQRDPSRIDALRRIKRPVGFLEIDLREKRLPTFQVFPIGGIERLRRVREIPICLTRAAKTNRRGKLTEVGGKVAGIAQPIGQRPHTGGQNVAIVTVRAVIVCADRGLIHPGHERRARRAANGRSRKHAVETHTVRGELIEMRRINVFSAIAPEIR